ncbi:MAG: hemolysin family protein [Anaerofustis sp.]
MPADPILWQLLLQFALILLNAVFSLAEIAIITMNDNKMAKLTAEGDKRATRLTNLTKSPARFLATIQVGITLAGFLASAFAADNFSDRIVAGLINAGVSVSESTLNTISVILITLILSYFTLVLGELVPKRIGMRNAEKMALGLSGFVTGISKIFAPIVWLLSVSTNGILRLIGIDPFAEDEVVTEEEIRMMVDAGSERGAIDESEKEIIQNVFEFDDKTAEEIMTHRTDVVLLWLDESNDVWEATINESRFSMFPVCSESVDDVIGVLSVKDYFRTNDRSRDNIMKTCIKPAYFVPDSVFADVLFRNMQKSRNHFAIVLDEYGGMSGIITMNDLLEQLVGDLEDDANVPEDPPLFEQIEKNKWLVHGSMPLDDLSKAIGVKLPDEDYDTFGGFVFGLIGTVPEDGSTPELEECGIHVQVETIIDHRLEQAIVTKLQTEQSDD